MMVQRSVSQQLHLSSFLKDEELKEILTFINEKKYELMRAKPNILARISFKGNPLFIKIFRRKKPFSFIFSPFRISSSFKCYQTALYMLKNGINTPKPILSFERRRGGFIIEDIYISEDIGEHLSAREILLKEEAENKEILVKNLAQVVKKLHESSIYHRDLNLSNFLIKGDKIYIVDINRARLTNAPISVFKMALDIARIDLHGYEKIFISEYATGMKHPSLLKNLILLFIKIRKVRRLRRFFVRLIGRVFLF